MGREVGGECIAQPAGVRRGCVGERKCSGRACCCAGVGEGLRRGMGCAVGGECIAQPAGVRRRCVGVRRGCVGERKCSARACRCAGARRSLRRGRCCEVGGECISQPAGMRRGSWGSGSAREGRVAVRGRAKVFGGEWVVRSAGRVSRSLRACVGAAGASEGLRRGMGGEVGGFNAHSPQQHARTCIIIYTSALSAP